MTPSQCPPATSDDGCAPPASSPWGRLASDGGSPFGARLESALAFACAQHLGQTRKGSDAAYIIHPLAVASVVGEYGGNEDQLIGALLHDTVEDCGVTPAQLERRYGARVAAIVVACTDATEIPKPPWQPRKEAFLARLRSQPAEAKLVVAADKWHNACSILRDIARPAVGAQVWQRFRVGRDEQLWYLREAVAALACGWDHDLLAELRRVIEELAAS